MAGMFDSDVLEEVLASDVYDVPNLTTAACVNGKNEAVIQHGVTALLHDRRSKDEHAARWKVENQQYVAQTKKARMPLVTELPVNEELNVLSAKSYGTQVNDAIAYTHLKIAELAKWMRWA